MSPVSIPGNAAIRIRMFEPVKLLTWNHKQCQTGFCSVNEKSWQLEK